jgi:hypothetical protein
VEIRDIDYLGADRRSPVDRRDPRPPPGLFTAVSATLTPEQLRTATTTS